MNNDKWTFRFKAFSVRHALSSHKVGIDSIILGAWAPFVNPRSILDVGTGCGLLALMQAQRFSSSRIIGIECDYPAVLEAKQNAAKSPWKDRIRIMETTLQAFKPDPESAVFDAIITNPPFFSNDLPSPDLRRNLARHTVELSHQALLLNCHRLLSDQGRLCLVIPTGRLDHFMHLAAEIQLFAFQITTVFPAIDCHSKISLIGLSKQNLSCRKDDLVIGQVDQRTEEFLALTAPYYLAMKKG